MKGEEQMEKATVKKDGAVIIRNVDVASGFWERFRGLMFAQSIPDSYGLLIKPCSQIHMMNMKFPLDIIYLSDDGTVINIDEDMQPWKIGHTVKNSACVIEVNSGTCARREICIGDRLDIENTERNEGAQ